MALACIISQKFHLKLELQGTDLNFLLEALIRNTSKLILHALGALLEQWIFTKLYYVPSVIIFAFQILFPLLPQVCSEASTVFVAIWPRRQNTIDYE